MLNYAIWICHNTGETEEKYYTWFRTLTTGMQFHVGDILTIRVPEQSGDTIDLKIERRFWNEYSGEFDVELHCVEVPS